MEEMLERLWRVILISSVASYYTTLRIQVDANIVIPSDDILYLKSGDELQLKCNTSVISNRLTNNVWYWAAPGVERYKVMDTNKSSGFITISHKTRSDSYEHGDKAGMHEISELSKSSVTPRDSGSYRCYSIGRLVDTVKVNVVEFNVTHGFVDALYNDTQLRCSVISSWPSDNNHNDNNNYSVTWYRRDVMLTSSTYKYTVNDGALIVHKVGDKDIGVYKCSVTFKSNGKSLSQEVSLYARPFVKFQEKSINLVDGMRLELKCFAGGWPSPDITWYRGDILLNSSQDLQKTVHSSDLSERRGIFSVNISSQADRGEYWCVAVNNVYGVQLSGRASILVRVKSRYAAIWPFLGICLEFLLLFFIIFIYERYHKGEDGTEVVQTQVGDKKYIAQNHSVAAANTTRMRQRM